MLFLPKNSQKGTEELQVPFDKHVNFLLPFMYGKSPRHWNVTLLPSHKSFPVLNPSTTLPGSWHLRLPTKKKNNSLRFRNQFTLSKLHYKCFKRTRKVFSCLENRIWISIPVLNMLNLITPSFIKTSNTASLGFLCYYWVMQFCIFIEFL